MFCGSTNIEDSTFRDRKAIFTTSQMIVLCETKDSTDRQIDTHTERNRERERGRQRETKGWGGGIALIYWVQKDCKNYRKVCCENNSPLPPSKADIC